MAFTINSKWGNFIFSISFNAFFEYTTSLIGAPPGARSNTDKSLTDCASTPGIAPHACDSFFEFDTTNNTLLPIFAPLPRSKDFPDLAFRDFNLIFLTLL